VLVRVTATIADDRLRPESVKALSAASTWDDPLERPPARAPLGKLTCQARFVECRSRVAFACNRPSYTEAAKSAVDLRAMPEGTGRHLRRRSIAWRLALGLGAVFLVIGAVSVTCLWALFDIHARLHALKSDEERARSVVRLASAVRDQYAHVAHTIIIRNDSHAELFREATRQLDALASTVRAEVGTADGGEIDRIIQASREIERLFETRVLPLARAGNGAALAEQHDQILRIALQAQREAESLARHAEQSMEDLNRHVRATQHGVILMTIIAHIIALTTALIVGIYLYRTIARPIAVLSEGAARVGRGDLDTVISIDREDELGQLSRRFNDMIASIKAHQKKLLQTERLVGLASMSAGIAHELNNPIGVILGYAKLLRRGDANDPKALAAIEEEAERCQQVIEGLLELTRGGVLHTTAVDVRVLADDVVRLLRVKGAPAGVALEVHGHATVQADGSKLRQVLVNLVGNAIDACAAEGAVVMLIDDPQPGIVTIEISDTGTGMALGVRERIFEPFFTTKPAGSGLGLAISRAIARAHGGDVTVASTAINKGTAFRITLPQKERRSS
jgi:two-component system, NtrC family, sensor kinase